MSRNVEWTAASFWPSCWWSWSTCALWVPFTQTACTSLPSPRAPCLRCCASTTTFHIPFSPTDDTCDTLITYHLHHHDDCVTLAGFVPMRAFYWVMWHASDLSLTRLTGWNNDLISYVNSSKYNLLFDYCWRFGSCCCLLRNDCPEWTDGSGKWYTSGKNKTSRWTETRVLSTSTHLRLLTVQCPPQRNLVDQSFWRRQQRLPKCQQ